MSENELVPQEAPLGLMTEIRRVEEVGTLKLKGYKNTDIAELLEIPVRKVNDYAKEYDAILAQKVEDDPDFFDRIGLNTAKILGELEEISKEAWESVAIATENAMITARIQAIKLALEANQKKAAMMQLGVGQTGKVDSEYIARMQRAETVNQIISAVIQEVISDCDRCREMSRVQLAEAFSMQRESAIDAEVIDD